MWTRLNVLPSRGEKCHGIMVNDQFIKFFCPGLNPGVMLQNSIPTILATRLMMITIAVTAIILAILKASKYRHCQ